jgi:hypothetical protein
MIRFARAGAANCSVRKQWTEKRSQAHLVSLPFEIMVA